MESHPTLKLGDTVRIDEGVGAGTRVCLDRLHRRPHPDLRAMCWSTLPQPPDPPLSECFLPLQFGYAVTIPVEPLRVRNDAMTTPSPPDFPFGEYVKETKLDQGRRDELLLQLKSFPKPLELAVSELTPEQREQTYRKWSIVQIVNHLADAQMNWFLRFKQALTMLNPTIVAYEQSDWVELADALSPDLAPSLAIIRGINARWFELASYMPGEDFSRAMVHPEHSEAVTLDYALSLSTWHCYHHLAQIHWMQKNIFVPSEAS